MVYHISPIILHACIDPPEPLEIPHTIPHQIHRLATLCYTVDLCHPAHHLLDARTRQLFMDLEQTIETHIDPWRSYLWDTLSGPPPPGLQPPNQRYGEAMESLLTTATDDIA